MNDSKWKQVEEQLPAGAKITKVYNGYEDGSLRIVVMLPGARYETRYFIHEDVENGEIRLEHRP